MLKHCRLLIGTCLLSLAIAAAWENFRPARVLALAPFDTDAAIGNATYLASTIGERPSGSTGEERAAGWIASKLSVLSYTVEVETFTFPRLGSEIAGMNVIGTKSGRPDYGTIYVGAHHDTVPRDPGSSFGGPGANDDASGSGIILELARALAYDDLSATVKFITFGAEEVGLAGSNHFVSHIPSDDKMRAIGMIDLDCVGLGDILHIYVADGRDKPFAESLGISAEYVGLSSSGDSDYSRFAAFGIPSVLLNTRVDDHPCGPDYHKSTDTADKLQRHPMERVGNSALQAIRRLASAASPRPVYHTFTPLVLR